jgi:hypothetical protein
MESSARFVAVLLLCHLAAAEFSENRDRLFGSVEPINTYAVVGVGVFRDLEHVVRSAVMKFHGQRIRREDVVGNVTTPLCPAMSSYAVACAVSAVSILPAYNDIRAAVCLFI